MGKKSRNPSKAAAAAAAAAVRSASSPNATMGNNTGAGAAPRSVSSSTFRQTIASSSAAVAASTTPPTTTGYPSDGPSYMEEEDDDDNHTMRLRTSSTSLQAKLDQLVDDIARDDRRSFVTHFVPLDLSVADTEAYLDTLLEISRSAARGDGMEEDNNNNAGGDEEWRNVAAEMVALATGRGVTRLGGDQIHRTVFYFCHPLLAQCDREVTFVCSSDGEWRAEG